MSFNILNKGAKGAAFHLVMATKIFPRKEEAKIMVQ